MDSVKPVACLSRKDNFTVQHSLHNPLLSSTANKQMYDVCYNRSIHSHQYAVEVICRGAVDWSVGTVFSLADLKKYMHRTIIEGLHGKYLNEDIDFFKTAPTTMENLAVYIWRNIKSQMDRPELLHEIKLVDDDENCVVYNGGGEYYNLSAGRQFSGCPTLTSDTD